MKCLKIGVLIVSDRCASGVNEDTSGPALVAALRMSELAEQFDIATHVCPDESEDIRSTVVRWVDKEHRSLIFTTGGTGFTPRDVTPEAIEPLLHRKAPGLAATMLHQSLAVTPMAALSRPVCGIRDRSIICTLPGSRKGATECLSFLLPVLGHALSQVTNSNDDVHRKMQSYDTQTHSLNCTTTEHPTHTRMDTDTHNNNYNNTEDSASGGGTNASAEHVQMPTHAHAHTHAHVCPHTNKGAFIKSAQDKAVYATNRVAQRYRTSPYELVSMENALQAIDGHCERLEEEQCSALNGDALCAIASQSVRSSNPYPPFPASVKDGYAVCSTDEPGIRTVLSSSVAGSVSSVKVVPGTIARITTGAPVPDGADAVVQVEDTELVEASADGKREIRVRILTKAHQGQDIRHPGMDIKPGEVVVAAGTRLGECELGLLAMVGTATASVYRKPRVHILSTGNELHPHDNGTTPPPGKIYDSNKVTLMSAVRSAGGKPVDAGVVVDRREALRDALEEALISADIIITTGGVSMGETDLIKPVLQDDLKADIHFGRVFMKPGKPATFATVQRGGKKVLFFGLPGNPVSAIVTFHLFVHPFIRKLCGHVQPQLPRIEVQLSFAARLDPRPEYQRANVRWDMQQHCFVAATTGSQCSSRLLSMKSANVLLEIPPVEEGGRTEIPVGTRVNAIVIGML